MDTDFPTHIDEIFQTNCLSHEIFFLTKPWNNNVKMSFWDCTRIMLKNTKTYFKIHIHPLVW